MSYRGFDLRLHFALFCDSHFYLILPTTFPNGSKIVERICGAGDKCVEYTSKERDVKLHLSSHKRQQTFKVTFMKYKDSVLFFSIRIPALTEYRKY